MTFHTSTTIIAELDSLPKVIEFVHSHAILAKVPETLKNKIDLVVEELFVNIVKYSYQDVTSERTDVEIQCGKEMSADTSIECFFLTFKDFGPPFNPLEQAPPSLDTDLDNRQVGGLGIYLVDLMADNCSYTREDESNLFHVCFNL